MAILITGLIVGLAVAFLFILMVVIAVPWAQDSYKKEGYQLLAENSPDPETLRDTIEALTSTDDEEAKELAARLTVRMMEEARALQDDQEEA
jgi:hypothetical protein